MPEHSDQELDDISTQVERFWEECKENKEYTICAGGLIILLVGTFIYLSGCDETLYPAGCPNFAKENRTLVWTEIQSSSLSRGKFQVMESFGDCLSTIEFDQRDMAQEYSLAHPVGSWAELYVSLINCSRLEFAKNLHNVAIVGVTIMAVGGFLMLLPCFIGCWVGVSAKVYTFSRRPRGAQILP